jgi:hypothetical protein
MLTSTARHAARNRRYSVFQSDAKRSFRVDCSSHLYYSPGGLPQRPPYCTPPSPSPFTPFTYQLSQIPNNSSPMSPQKSPHVSLHLSGERSYLLKHGQGFFLLPSLLTYSPGCFLLPLVFFSQRRCVSFHFLSRLLTLSSHTAGGGQMDGRDK